MSGRQWAYELQGSSLRFGLADPTDQAIDGLACGSEEWSAHVTEYFRKRRWLKGGRTCYQFGTDEDIIGYASVAVAPCAHRLIAPVQVVQA